MYSIWTFALVTRTSSSNNTVLTLITNLNKLNTSHWLSQCWYAVKQTVFNCFLFVWTHCCHRWGWRRWEAVRCCTCQVSSCRKTWKQRRTTFRSYSSVCSSCSRGTVDTKHRFKVSVQTKKHNTFIPDVICVPKQSRRYTESYEWGEWRGMRKREKKMKHAWERKPGQFV